MGAILTVGGLLRGDRLHVPFTEQEILRALDLDLKAGVREEQHAVAGFHAPGRQPAGRVFFVAISGWRHADPGIPAWDVVKELCEANGSVGVTGGRV